MARPKQRSKSLARPADSRRASAPLPAFVSPQLCTLATEPPEGSGWLHEVKYDGYRAIAAIGGGRCRIYTRSGHDWTAKFSSVATALRQLEVSSALLDGEIVALDQHGRSSFQLLQRSLKDGHIPLTYYLFDILELDGRNLSDESLSQRKKILKRLLAGVGDPLRYSEDVVGHGKEILARSCRMGLEGIVSKQTDKPYLSKRSHSWLKTKCTGNEEFVIGGYRLSDKKGRPFSSLLLGEFVGDKLHYRGRVGTGFDAATLAELAALFAKLKRTTCPFVEVPRAIVSDARWVQPKLVAQIAYTERTSDGVLRHPAYLGLRGDKPAQQVQAQAAAVKGAEPDSDDLGIALSNPSRVLFTEAGLTKLDLARYLLAVSGRMLPYVSGRPISLVRCPNGVAKQCFFQKHIKKGMPPAIQSVRVTESDGETADYLMIDDAAGLVAFAQIGGIEIHLWGARADALERPDRLVFDLDPDPGIDFAAVRQAARDVRSLLRTAGITTFPLLTGGKGIHVVAPLDASQDWSTVKNFARGVAVALAANEPQRFVANMSKAKRKGRIFIDYLRNERGATAIAPYSPRARPQASVAVPITWAELASVERSDAYTIPMVLQRLKRKANPWQGYFDARQNIPAEALKFFTDDAP